MDNYKCEFQSRSDPEGRYADRFRIGYRECVFVLDFLQSFYNDKKKRVHTRIITSPEDLKNFLKLIQGSIEKYEKNYGPICIEDKEEQKQLE